MRLWTALKLYADWCFSATRSEYSGYLLAERLTQWFHPRYPFSEFGRSWLEDNEFWTWYRQFPGWEHDHSADRKYFLRQLLALVQQVDGDTAECGVYLGASSYLICAALHSAARHHHLFDSFAGLSSPGPEDGMHWQPGQFAVSEQEVRRNLAQFSYLEFHPGWIPESLAGVDQRRFCFVHLDVDLYHPTREAARFFYDRLSPGGIMLCDDYGFRTCPGARQAMDELAQEIPEPLIHVPTGQAFLVRQRTNDVHGFGYVDPQ